MRNIKLNEANFRRNEEMNIATNYIIRSSGDNYDERSGQFNIYERREIDMSQQFGQPKVSSNMIPQYSLEIDQRKDGSKSPKTINIGESPQEA